MSTAEVNLISDEDCVTSALPISGSSFTVIPSITIIDDIKEVIAKAISYKIKPQAGLLDAVGAWEDYEDIDGFIDEVYKKRKKSLDRTVDI